MKPDGQEYHAWRLPVRLFHWINLATVIWLTGGGLCLLYENELALPGPSRILFKMVHAWGGYVFAINLLVRLIWGLIDRGHGGLRRLPLFRRGFAAELKTYLAGGQSTPYIGLNPLGGLMVCALLILLLTAAGTGLILAGTDLYHGPFGGYFAGWVAAPGVDIATLMPGERNSPKISKDAMAALRVFRAPISAAHLYAFYAILVFSACHIGGVVWMECRKGVSVVSAMISGRKRLTGVPADRD